MDPKKIILKSYKPQFVRKGQKRLKSNIPYTSRKVKMTLAKIYITEGRMKTIM